MIRTIHKIHAPKAALFAAVIVFFLSFPIIGMMQFFRSFATNEKFPWLMLTVIPASVAVLVFFFAIISCCAYNLLAKLIGGIEIETNSNQT